MSLLRLVKANDADAWGQFVQLYTPLIRYWCIEKSRLSPDDARDVVQDVLLAVSKAIADFERDQNGGSLRGWLRVITQNRIRNLIRQQQTRPRATGGTTAAARIQDTPDLTLEDDTELESSIIMKRAIELLEGEFNESTYRAFWLSAVDGLGNDLIAERLEMTPQAVRQACYRVRRRLRTELSDLL